MQNHIKTKLLLVSNLFLIIVALQCCKSCNPCPQNKPLKITHHVGIFDSIKSETRVIFESNTGKLDTATYSRIENHSNYISGDNGTKNECDDFNDSIYYQTQSLSFKNKLGYEYMRGNFDNLANYTDQWPPGTIYGEIANFPIYTYENFLDTFISQYGIFNDVAIRSTPKGYYCISKKYGLVAIKYLPNSNGDTLYTFKTIIK